MANASFYKESDIPTFQEEVCKKTCIMKGQCIEEGKDNHWFLMCPHYFNWKIGYKSFIAEQFEWERAHPQEAEEKHRQLAELAKQWKKTKSIKKSSKPSDE